MPGTPPMPLTPQKIESGLRDTRFQCYFEAVRLDVEGGTLEP
jgi:hypothetical protein